MTNKVHEDRDELKRRAMGPLIAEEVESHRIFGDQRLKQARLDILREQGRSEVGLSMDELAQVDEQARLRKQESHQKEVNRIKVAFGPDLDQRGGKPARHDADPPLRDGDIEGPSR